MIPLYHRCGGVAFYTTGEAVALGNGRASQCVLLDGSKPQVGSKVLCGTCGQPIGNEGVFSINGPHFSSLNVN